MCKTKQELNLEKEKNLFFRRANARWNYQWDYSKSVYVDSKTPIEIICKDHGSYWRTPEEHLSNFSCPICGENHSKRGLQTTEEYIEEVTRLYDGYFKYPNTVYTARDCMILIECPRHGEVSVNARNHRKGIGCPKCNKEKVAKEICIGKEQFVIKANNKFDNKFNYDKFEYVNNHTKGLITCPEHGDILISPVIHLKSPTGCPHCSNKAFGDRTRRTNEEIIQILNDKRGGEGFTFEKVDYTSHDCNITITCPKHGDFDISLDSFLLGASHPKSRRSVSNMEIELQKYVESLGYEILANKKRTIYPYELDIFIPELNKAIEFNGTYWHYTHSNPRCKPKGYHAMKSNLCRDKGIKLLHIREDLWLRDKEFMKERVKIFLELPNK